MGRLSRMRKRHRKSRAVGRHERRPKAAGSDPEPCGPESEEPFNNETNSLDDETLSQCTTTSTTACSSRCECHTLPTPTYNCVDEMEVTWKLSCLNFSVLPPAMSMDAVPRDVIPHPHVVRDFEVLSDVELCSELACPSHLDLLPTLSDRDMEGLEISHKQRRKRPSKRRNNHRRTKKLRYSTITTPASCSKTQWVASSLATTSSSATALSSQQQPLPLPVVTPAKDIITPTIHPRRSRSFRRGKCYRNQVLEDGFLSDTSVAYDPATETGGSYGKANHQEMEWVGLDDEATPPAQEEREELATGPAIESELSETTSDSGCEGDDEESSVEGPSLLQQCEAPSPSWLLRHQKHYPSVTSTEDSKQFQQILEGTFPLLSADGQYHMSQLCGGSEFKHPGRFGVCQQRGSGRKKRCKPRELASPLTLHDINQKIVDYIRDPSADSVLKFPPLSRALCRTIALLSDVYQLECSVEQQKRRLPVASPRLRKTSLTRLASKEEIEPVMRQHSMSGSAGLLHAHSSRGRQPERTGRGGHPQGPPDQSNLQDTSVEMVGSGSQPLDRTNLGNRMLQGMGWMPGTGLGPQCDGIRSPVKAYFRTKHMGLGFS